MMKINFKTPLTTLGRPVVDELGKHLSVHSELAFYLSSMNTSNYLKNNIICTKMYENGEIELDEVDLAFLEKNINECRTAPDYLRASASNCIKEAKEKSKE